MRRWASARSSSTATCSRPTAAPAPRRSAAATSPSTTPSPASCRPGTITTHPLTAFCAAISVGIVDGVPVLDLPYVEDSRAEVDMNVVMTCARRLRRGAGHRRGRAVLPGRARHAARPGRGRHRRDHRPPAARWSASRPRAAVTRAPGWPPATPTRSRRSRTILGPGYEVDGARSPTWRRPARPSRRTPCSRPGPRGGHRRAGGGRRLRASRSTPSTARPGVHSARWTERGRLDPAGPARARRRARRPAAAAATSARRPPRGPTVARSWCGARSRA